MRELYTMQDFAARGLTRAAIRWGERHGKWRSICRGVWGAGPDDPSAMDRFRAMLVAAGGIADGEFAGFLHGYDSLDRFEYVTPSFVVAGSSSARKGGRRRLLPPDRVVEVAGHRCTNPLQTLLDLASVLTDLRWEQVL